MHIYCLDKMNLVFITFEKGGSTTIANYIKKTLDINDTSSSFKHPGHLHYSCGGRKINKYKDKIKNFTFYVILREPKSRCLSGYYNKAHRLNKSYQNMDGKFTNKEFNNYLRQVKHKLDKSIRLDHHISGVNYQIKHEFPDLFKMKKLNFVKLENLHDCLKDLYSTNSIYYSDLGKHLDLLKLELNPSTKNKIIVNRDNDNLIRKIFKKDFELYDKSF